MKGLAYFLFACLVAGVAPLVRHATTGAYTKTGFPGWAAAPISLHSAPAPLGERERRFAVGFPGELAVFHEEERLVLIRWMAAPNRMLHPASDCLRALGYAVEPGPLTVSSDGLRWGTLSATRGKECLRIRERIVDSIGQEWTDVSSWYWSTLLGRSIGPWWAMTIFEPKNEND